jgi:hypothetical protein
MKYRELTIAIHAALMCRAGKLTRSFKLGDIEYPYQCDPIGQ